MLKPIVFSVFVLAALTGCYKRDETHLNQKCTKGCAVFNFSVMTGGNLNAPVPGAYVDLVWEGPKQEIGGGPSIDVANGYADAQGRISFSFKPIGDEFTSGDFTVTAKSTADYIKTLQYFENVRRADTVLNATLALPSIAHLKLIYKNFDPKNQNDAFSANPNYRLPYVWQGLMLTSSDPTNYPNDFFDIYQKPFDSLTYVGNTAGNAYTYFQVVIKRNGLQIFHLDSLYIAKGDTGTYTLDYQRSFQ
ncbi:MAG: hypothetical protein JST19_18420 [Bacteroidetes bacterium]|nr:hypothetical protein [Bacteroidota bacterium]